MLKPHPNSLFALLLRWPWWVGLVIAARLYFVSPNRANRELYDALCGKGISARIVGDANSPRYLPTAIREGHLAGAAV